MSNTDTGQTISHAEAAAFLQTIARGEMNVYSVPPSRLPRDCFHAANEFNFSTELGHQFMITGDDECSISRGILSRIISPDGREGGTEIWGKQAARARDFSQKSPSSRLTETEWVSLEKILDAAPELPIGQKPPSVEPDCGSLRPMTREEVAAALKAADSGPEVFR